MPTVMPPVTTIIPGQRTTISTRDGVVTTNKVEYAQAGTKVYSRNSHNTPDFFTRVTTGLRLPVNTFGYASEKHTDGFGYYRTYYVYQKHAYESVVSGSFSGSYNADNPLAISALEKQNLYNGALAAARLAVKSEKVNLAVAAAEAPMTWDLLRTTFDRLSKTYSFVRKGKFIEAAILLPNTLSVEKLQKLWRRDKGRAVSRAVLELQYGWRPLLADIYGSLVALDRGYGYQKPLVRVASEKKLVREKTSTTVSGPDTTTIAYKTEYARKVVLFYELNGPRLALSSSLGLTNPALVAWELVPFSFVVDWLCQVGNWISQFDATLGWTYVMGSDTNFTQSVVLQRWTTHGPKSIYSQYDRDILAKRENIDCGRTGIIQEPISLLPYVKDPFSNEHALNAFALLHTNLRK